MKRLVPRFLLMLPQVTRWRIVTALEVASEVAIIALPCFLVSSVLIGSKPKMIVMIAFGFRLPYVESRADHKEFLLTSVVFSLSR